MNCKPGDLAIVVRTPTGKHTGAVLKVLSAWGEYSGLGHIWNVEMPREVLCQSGIMKRFCQCPDTWLRPVSGLPIDEETRDDIKESA